MSVSITYDALEKNKQSLFVTDEPKRKRGRPPKAFITEELQTNTTDVTITKPTINNADFLVAYPEQPKVRFGQWQKIHVAETSEVFLKWLDDCQEIVDNEFGAYEWDLKVRKYSKYIWIIMEHKSKKVRPFAFIDRSTGNIHCPATFDDPFEHYVGNIIDPSTRLSTIGPYGVTTQWSFLPTHPDNIPVK
jgi:hypothetical protein